MGPAREGAFERANPPIPGIAMTAEVDRPSPEARYAELRAAFFSGGEVSPSEKKGFGASALTTRGRIFAMLARGRLVVKLPKARVDALVREGWAGGSTPIAAGR